MNAIVYDCEIVKAIPDRKFEPLEGIQYCKGWNDHAEMGISCIGVYDYMTDAYRVFMEDNFNTFKALVNSTDAIIGYNNGGFDDLLVKACLGLEIPPERSYDLLSEVWKSAGLGPRYKGSAYAGYSLGALAKANQIGSKTGTGEHAPVMWQRGKFGAVIDYCLHDVWLTKSLVDRILTEGNLNNPKPENGVGSILQIGTFAKLK